MAPYKFLDFFSPCVCEKCHWNFNKDCVGFVDHFVEYGFFDILSIYLCLVQFFFICSLQFAVYKSFTSLIMFIPKYFIVSNVTVSRTAFLMSLSDSLLLAYQNASDFRMFILYLATLLNLFILTVFFCNY